MPARARSRRPWVHPVQALSGVPPFIVNNSDKFSATKAALPDVPVRAGGSGVLVWNETAGNWMERWLSDGYRNPVKAPCQHRFARVAVKWRRPKLLRASPGVRFGPARSRRPAAVSPIRAPAGLIPPQLPARIRPGPSTFAAGIRKIKPQQQLLPDPPRCSASPQIARIGDNSLLARVLPIERGPG